VSRALGYLLVALLAGGLVGVGWYRASRAAAVAADSANARLARYGAAASRALADQGGRLAGLEGELAGARAELAAAVPTALPPAPPVGSAGAEPELRRLLAGRDRALEQATRAMQAADARLAQAQDTLAAVRLELGETAASLRRELAKAPCPRPLAPPPLPRPGRLGVSALLLVDGPTGRLALGPTLDLRLGPVELRALAGLGLGGGSAGTALAVEARLPLRFF